MPTYLLADLLVGSNSSECLWAGIHSQAKTVSFPTIIISFSPFLSLPYSPFLSFYFSLFCSLCLGGFLKSKLDVTNNGGARARIMSYSPLWLYTCAASHQASCWLAWTTPCSPPLRLRDIWLQCMGCTSAPWHSISISSASPCDSTVSLRNPAKSENSKQHIDSCFFAQFTLAHQRW